MFDFSDLKPGSEVSLPASSPVLNQNFLRFIITDEKAQVKGISSRLLDEEKILAHSSVDRRFIMRSMGMMGNGSGNNFSSGHRINGKSFDPQVINEEIVQNTSEV